ncbi:MAG: chloride channel protein [Oscillospiraceae bacterium]|nr:chloride channel protein [Oscillospiraceae bacterium]
MENHKDRLPVRNSLSARIKTGARSAGKEIAFFLKWVMISMIVGLAAGFAGTAFSYGLKFANHTIAAHPALMFGLPVAGVLIVWLYHITGRANDKGTDQILLSVQTGERVSIIVAPLIVLSTILTHLFGGSAGREGAALQMGGSIASGIGKLFRLDKREMQLIAMCGMSAGFAALFGTPVAAAVFALEVAGVGVIGYPAFAPCVIAGLTASRLATVLGVEAEHFTILSVPALTPGSLCKVLILSALCAGVSILLCVAMHTVSDLMKKYFKNPYLRAAAGGAIIILLTLILRTNDYLGAGMDVILQSFNGSARPEAFLLKILFTAITLGSGFKGGEIVPSFFIGSVFGCVFGNLLGFSPSLCAAVGMLAVFCGATNSPFTALLIGLELCGTSGVQALPYFLLAAAVSFTLSGDFSLYHNQVFLFPKDEAAYIAPKGEFDSEQGFWVDTSSHLESHS